MEKATSDRWRAGSRSNPVLEFFDETAEEYALKYSEETPAGYALRSRRKKVLQLFDKPGGKVLDVGCGPGIMAEELARQGCEFWGVDASAKMIDLARRNAEVDGRTHFLLGEATDLDWPDSSFDAVLCMGVMDRIPDARRAIREMLRVLKPEGTLIVTFANLHCPTAWWKKFVFLPAVAQIQRILRSGKGDRPSLAPHAKDAQLYTEGAARALVAAEGATIVQTAGYYFSFFLAPLEELWPSGALWFMKKFEERQWPCPEWLAAGFILKARKAVGAQS